MNDEKRDSTASFFLKKDQIEHGWRVEHIWNLVTLVYFPAAGSNMDVSNNRGTPKWMVYDGKPY